MPAGDLEGINREEADRLVADGAPRILGQLPPELPRGEVRLEDEGAAVGQALERVGVDEGLVVGRDDDLDLLELGVREEDRLGG